MTRVEGPPQEQASKNKFREWHKNLINRAYIGTAVFALGGAGVFASNQLSESFPVPSLLVNLVSWVAIIGGGGVALESLTELVDYLRTHHHGVHYHPGLSQKNHTHPFMPHSHPESHKPADIDTPPPAKALTFRQQLIRLRGEDLQKQFQDGLTELGVSTRTRNTLIRRWSWKPEQRTPLTLAGLRLFLKYEIPILTEGIGPATIAELRGKVAPITYPQTIDDYQKLTQHEFKAAYENGFIQQI